MPGTTPEVDLRPRITVFGVGGAGGNAVNNMIQKDLEGVEFVVANTDAQALAQNSAQSRIQLGARVTEGLGAGARPQVGASAAEETIEEIVDRLAGAHMCFITAGMGGGTGTGAAPIIAQAARELGILTVGVVTKPFQFEGSKRMRQAEEGVEALQKVVDTLIIIPNQNLFRLANERTTFTEAFSMADDVLYQGVKGVTDLMVRPGMINLDFADVRSVMDEMGKAMMGTGEGEGEDRAVEAAEKAIANPLLDELSLSGAKGVLINITGGHDLTLFEMDEAANRIRKEVDEDANIIVGSTLDPSMEGFMRVSVVATGIDASAATTPAPMPRRRMSSEAPAVAAAPVEAPVEAPVAAAEVAAPAPVAEVPAEPETPNFFDAMDQQEAEEAEVAQSFFDDAPTTEATDDLPPPAYTPAPAPQPVAAAEPPQARFTAPRPTGAPSPEAMDRLRAAVSKGERSVTAEPPRAPAAGEGRFGIGSLINRMTGTAADTPVQRPAEPTPTPAQAAAPEEDERIEIPAFLRRQAN
ncbi:cell division protein FtsZ [Jannaschia marina]|uniref:cell division protein FtsZ n=1 Tax=Jannaschia marina TaxID=2741674 RepID=UPI0038B321CA